MMSSSELRAAPWLRQVSALKENMGIGLSANMIPLQTDVKEQKVREKRDLSDLRGEDRIPRANDSLNTKESAPRGSLREVDTC